LFNYFPPHTGSVQGFTVSKGGTYKLEVWGAQGGGNWPGENTIDGYGGYSYGNIKLTSGQIMYIYVGQSAGAYNGGGIGAAPGGGATHIAMTNRGELKTYLSYQSEVAIVAGGGGGLEWGGKGGDGGGVTGNNGISQANSIYSASACGTGGTQSSGGTSTIPPSSVYSGTSALVNGSFGQGGCGYTTDGSNDYGAGGGGGWYGGGGTSHSGAGGGGSGHLGSMLTNTSMQSGVQTGNGYAKITQISF